MYIKQHNLCGDKIIIDINRFLMSCLCLFYDIFILEHVQNYIYVYTVIELSYSASIGCDAGQLYDHIQPV